MIQEHADFPTRQSLNSGGNKLKHVFKVPHLLSVLFLE